ncbi:MAG: hypothetical protein ACFE8J_08775 [Candidatus Heimdallarchaeota archaeon]
MTLDETIVNLIPVLFGWILGVTSLGIPKLFGWLNAKSIQRKYSPLISQIRNGKLSKTANVQMPSKIAGKSQSFSALPEPDKKLLFEKLPEIVLFNSDWDSFERIVKYLDKKMHK